MTAPRLTVDLAKITHNAGVLVSRLGAQGIGVTAVTKACLGSAAVAKAMRLGGVAGLADSRIENLRTLREASVAGPMTLIRSPMLSQVEDVVRYADTSLNSEPTVLAALSAAAVAQDRSHAVVLMVELGDLREGILPDDLLAVVRQTLLLPNLVLAGLGTNLACQSGVEPDHHNMAELSRLTDLVEAACGISLTIVSGGNSANLDWALSTANVGRVDDLRLGESILLGREPLRRRPIEGLHTDAFRLFAEVIESKVKPSEPWGHIAQTAFGVQPRRADVGDVNQALLAIGRQDVDPDGLVPQGPGRIIGASSDHLVLDAGPNRLAVGDEVAFEVDYSALVRSMTSPYVIKVLITAS